LNRLPDPIESALDLKHRVLYLTIVCDAPRGHTVKNRAIGLLKPDEPEIRSNNLPLMEGSAIAWISWRTDVRNRFCAGSLYSAKLDGTEANFLYARATHSTTACTAEI